MCLLLVVMVTGICSLCVAENSVTYTFPDDACLNKIQPQISLRHGETVYVGFHGDFGEPGCRTMSFGVSQSIFWYNKVCLKFLFYSSPQCESRVLFIPSSSKQIVDYWWNKLEMSGMGCQSQDGYRPDDGVIICGKYFTTFDVQLRKNGKKIQNTPVEYRYEWESNNNHKPTAQAPIPNRINDTFGIQLTSELEYRVDVIGGISGGLIDLIVLVVITTRICMCLRKRKRLTGRYFSEDYFDLKISDGIKKYITLSEGCSTECSGAGILLCSCVMCIRRDRQKTPDGIGEITEFSKVPENVKSPGEDQGKWPSIDDLDKTDVAPYYEDIICATHYMFLNPGFYQHCKM